ncbi:HET-domain-containing protein, partial [Patellaria atrata CBS 101060]
GKSRHVITEKASLEKWKVNIPWRLLPKIFQDAVIIARQLGVKYVWIDSLYIIQDDGGDWEEEAVNMADIYQRAFLATLQHHRLMEMVIAFIKDLRL